eukprot:m51a1_g3232 putative m7 -mrna hydrolase isoform x2 (375) ;mRNA; f:107285-108943
MELLSPRDERLLPVIDDLCCRFIVNMPQEEFDTTDRVLFLVEEAHWFYTDFYQGHAPPDDPSGAPLPPLDFRRFASLIFRRCQGLLQLNEPIDKVIDDFHRYKGSVPVYGCILLNPTMDKVLLVKGNGRSWGFPKGKVNQAESPADCAAREALEETGYDVTPALRPELFLESSSPGGNPGGARLYICTGTNEAFAFAPRVRGEITDIRWFNLAELPLTSADRHYPRIFYSIVPYMRRLMDWVRQEKAATVAAIMGAAGGHSTGASPPDMVLDIRRQKQQDQLAQSKPPARRKRQMAKLKQQQQQQQAQMHHAHPAPVNGFVSPVHSPRGSIQPPARLNIVKPSAAVLPAFPSTVAPLTQDKQGTFASSSFPFNL